MAYELLVRFVNPDASCRREVKRRLIEFLESNGRFDYVEGVLDGVSDQLTSSEVSLGLTDEERFEDLPLALFDESETASRNLSVTLFHEFNDEIRVEINHITDESWQRCWASEFASMMTKRFLIVPMGSPEPTPASLIRVEIDAAHGAFGTGQHATTRAIIDALETRWENWKPKSVLDVGTGTGIYLIIAGHLGAARLAGTEISDELVTLAANNLEAAGFRGTLLCDDRPRFSETFDLIIANILVPVLHELLPDFVKLLTQNGVLILAGFVTKERVPLMEKARLYSLEVESITSDSGWECVVLRKNQ